jgi:hypothetical protein
VETLYVDTGVVPSYVFNGRSAGFIQRPPGDCAGEWLNTGLRVRGNVKYAKDPVSLKRL